MLPSLTSGKLRVSRIVAALALVTACGGPATGPEPGPGTPTVQDPMVPGPETRPPVMEDVGSLELSLAASPTDTYREVGLAIQQIELQDPEDQAWLPVASPNRTVDVTKLTAGAPELLGEPARLPRKHFKKLRLVLGSGSLRLRDGSLATLQIPEGIRAGLVLDIDLDMRLDTRLAASARLVLDVDITRSIQTEIVSGRNTYWLRPWVRTYEQEASGQTPRSGTIRGVLRAKQGGLLLRGQRLFAEALDAQGRPYIAQTAYTDTQGRYTLSGLPLGQKYHVVSRPYQDGQWYQATGSPALDLGASALADLNLEVEVDAAAAVSTVTGNLWPFVPSSCDRIELVRLLDCGPSGNTWLIVDSALSLLDRNVSYYRFTYLPKGRYAVQSSRMQCGPTGACGWSPLAVSTALDLGAGGITELDLTLGP